MKLTHVLGHRSNWNLDIYQEQHLGDGFLIAGYTHGTSFDQVKKIQSVLDRSMIDLQFYAKKETITERGRLSDFDFHPVHYDENQVTSVYLIQSIKQAVEYQEQNGFEKVIIPNFYEENDVTKLIGIIREVNSHINSIKKEGIKYFMTLPLANKLVKDRDKVEALMMACTDMEICFDGYFIVCESTPIYGQKITIDFDLIKNLSHVFITLKQQEYETIYAYANFDAIIYLAQTDIDYITIGSYENLRNFNLTRFTETTGGGPSAGYYFSEKLLNMVRAADLTMLRRQGVLDRIRNENNIFSDIILESGYPWNIHKPDIHKNYLLSVGRLLKNISEIENIASRKQFVIEKIEEAENIYRFFQKERIALDSNSENYHLNIWKTCLST